MLIPPEHAMDIRFCDLCQESIPDADFESGKAVTIDARTLCVACAVRRALSLSGARSWITLLLALFGAGAAVFLLLRRPAGAELSPAVSAALAEQTRATGAEIDRREQALGQALRFERAREVEDAQRALERVGGDLRALGERVDADRTGLDGVLVELRSGLASLAERQAELHAWMQELKSRAAREIAPAPVPGDAPPEAPAPSPLPAPAPVPAPSPGPARPEPTPLSEGPGEAPVPPAGTAPDDVFQRQLELLGDPDPGVAFSATIELGKLRDLRAVPPLVNALRKHRDFYVRLGAADALRELKSCDAVEHLIDALTDKDDLVRSSVNVALEGITSHEEPFAPNLPGAELRRVQTAWRKWWKDNEPLVRKRLGQPRA